MRTLGEIVKELYQGRRQQVRNVLPRVRRAGAYVFVRGVTNVLLRDLNLSLVAEHMSKAAPVIFVDLVDYDEIAHHAGPERPESMRAIEGPDGVLGQLKQVADALPTDYRVVVLSDHGQSLGPTFAQINVGQSLQDLARGLMEPVAFGRTVEAVPADEGDEFGPFNALIASVLGRSSTAAERVVVGLDAREKVGREAERVPELAVIGSCNLGMIWFPRLSERPDLADITASWTRLIPGLAATTGTGLVW